MSQRADKIMNLAESWTDKLLAAQMGLRGPGTFLSEAVKWAALMALGAWLFGGIGR